MSPEAEIEAALDAFEQNTRPIFVFYGDVPYFPRLISQFRAKYQLHDEYDYLTVDLELALRESVAETLFEILRQLAYGFRIIERFQPISTKSRLNETLKVLPNLLERLKISRAEEDKLEEFHNFFKWIFLTSLEQNILERSIIIEFSRLEVIDDTRAGTNANTIYRVILRDLFESLQKLQLQCTFFSQDLNKPSLFNGSNEETTGEEIQIHKLKDLKQCDPKHAFQEKFKLILERKMDQKDYDVFLCYNSKDESEVNEIRGRLMERGILPWLDKWEIRPGKSKLHEIEEQIKRAKSVAIFLSSDEIGSEQLREYEAAFRQANEKEIPIIPVFLKSFRGNMSNIPSFLQGQMWVDFGIADPDPFEQLIWGITGDKPRHGSGESEEPS